MESLEGRAAVVTGAASGIGLAVAEALAGAGARVLMTDLDGEALARVASEVASAGADIDTLPVDVRDPAALERAADHAVDRFGGLHIAVSNAGIVNGGNSWELPLEEWHRVIDVNLWGVIHGVHAFVPRILQTGEEGHVVNVASMAAVVARAGIGPYTVSKHGVLGLSDVLRAELEAAGAPVGVSVVMPGMIRTGMNPIGSVEPSAVAANVVDAIRRGRPYVFTDDHSADAVDARLRQILASRADVLPG
jgi:NAD(P)-dependent dehydrogenase (short-subunit alcohol dehydrogenase family)